MEAPPRTFYDHFAANMHATWGLPAPRELFGQATLAVATIKALATAIEQGGDARLTLRLLKDTAPQLVRAAGLGRLATLAGGVMAAFYVGACLASLRVATDAARADLDRELARGIAGPYLQQAHRLGIRAPWVLPTFTELAIRAAARPRP